MLAETERNGGFTLVEVLVVFALTSLVSMLLMQFLSTLYRSHDLIQRFQGEDALEVMQFYWFGLSIGASVASLDADFSFNGTESEISAYTMAPLIGRQGELTLVSWRVANAQESSSLWYRENDEPYLQIGSWKNTKLAFSYRGFGPVWMDSWPHGDIPKGVLPHRVKLTLDSNGVKEEVFGAIELRRTGRYDYRELIK